MSEFKFADSILHRIVQIVQEALLLGVDCSDIMRQVRVVPDETDPHVLVLSAEYLKQVREQHDKLLAQARDLQGQQKGNKFMISGHDDDEEEAN